MSGCWHAPLRCQPGNLRLPFRLVRTGICTAASSRRTDAIRHHPPTHKWTDERTEISPWHSLIFRRGQECRRLRLFSPPGAWLPLWLSTAHSLSRLHPCHRRLRAFLAEVPMLSTSAKNRCVLRVERLRPPACHPLFPDTAPASRGRARMSAPAVINSL